MLGRLLRQFWKGNDKSASDPLRASASDDESYRNSPAQWLQHGQALQDAGELDAAVECYRACAAAYPSDLLTRVAIANALSAAWRMEECIAACAEALSVAPRQADVFSGYLYHNHYTARPHARALFDLHRRYGDMMLAALPPRRIARSDFIPDPERPLRIGYLSHDFRTHSVAYFVEPVIAHHDRSRYHIHAYHTHEHIDETSQRIMQSVDAWRHVCADGIDTLAERIREDRIDILVDLGGHTTVNRLGVFARRPAPVQMTWLGYPDTTGLTTIDYRITDPIADPAPMSDGRHTERLLRLAAPFLCYQPPADSPPVALRDATAPVVFGSFNALMKVNDALIGLWAQILEAVPGSRLLMKSALLDNNDVVNRLLECFEGAGIGPERIDLRGWAIERTQHLSAYSEVDIALDTLPYNGTTTTCEALWMGVPVITLAGDLHMSRVGASLLTAAGLQALVASTPEEYVRTAIDLARNPERQRAMRIGMRGKLAVSPLLDHAGFARKLESGYRLAWRAWCEAQQGSASAAPHA